MSADSPRFPEHRLSRSVRAVLLGLTFSAAGLAYAADDTTAGAEVEATRAFDIPAGPLGRSLAAAAVQGGLALSFDPALTEGRHSPGMSGRHAPHDAMRRLLAGSGLEMRQRPDGSYTLRKLPAGAQSATVLQEVLVNASRGTGSSEETKSYTVASTSSATKLDLAIKDTPQVVSVITRQRMEDQNLTQVADVMAQAPGVTVQQQGVPGMGQIDYWSRGFAVNNVMFDGVVTQAAGNGNFVLWSLLDTAVFDRVELVQGSTGLATGVGDPSASVNFVRKRPTYERQAEVTGSYGSWDRGRATADFSGPLTDSGKLRGRFVAAQQQGGTWQDRVKGRSSTLYGIVEGEPTERLTLTAGATYGRTRVDDAAPFGVYPATDPSYNNSTRFDTTSLGRSYNPATQWSFADIELLNPFAKLEWRINESWKVNASYMYSDVKQQRLIGTMGQVIYDPADDLASFEWANFKNRGEIHNADISLSGKLRFLDREHDLVVGMTGYRGELITDTATTSAPFGGQRLGLTVLKISEWNNGNVPFPTWGAPGLMPDGFGFPFTPNPTYDPLNQYRVWESLGSPDNVVDEQQRAQYIATRLRPVDRLQVILGARKNYWKRDHVSWGLDMDHLWAEDENGEFINADDYVWVSGEPAYHLKVEGKTTPYAGLIFDVTDKVTVYASYTGISRANFQNGNSLAGRTGGWWPRDRNGKMLPPIEGNSKEIGVKGAFFNDKLNMQFTAFRMEQKNMPVSDLASGVMWRDPFAGFSLPAALPDAGAISEGFEFNVAGQVTDRINLAASYSRLDMEYKQTIQEGSTAALGTNDYCVSGTGLRQFQCPKHTVKMFGTWQATNKLTIGGGVNWKSKTGPTGSVHADPKFYTQDAFYVADLMARYALTPDLTVGAHVGNVFDKEYLTTQDRYSSYYGAPRNFTVSVGYKF